MTFETRRRDADQPWHQDDFKHISAITTRDRRPRVGNKGWLTSVLSARQLTPACSSTSRIATGGETRRRRMQSRDRSCSACLQQLQIVPVRAGRVEAL